MIIMNRYRVNLVLFWIVLALTILWFYRNLHLYFKQTFFVGIPLTLGLLIGQIRSWSKPFIGEKTTFIKHLMSKPKGTGYLIIGLSTIILLLLTTSSIYFEYVESGGDSDGYEVEVDHHGKMYVKTKAVTSYDRIKGHPHFGISRLWNPLEATFKIVKPLAYAPKKITLHPWSRVYLRIPADFDKKEFRIIRLLPNRTLLRKLPRVDDSDKSSCSIKISIVDANDANNTQEYPPIENVLMETIYFGAEKEVIEKMVNAEKDETRYIIIRNYLTNIEWERSIDEFTRVLSSSERYRCCPTKELKPGQIFNIVFEIDVGKEKPERSDPIQGTVSDTVGIQNYPIPDI